MKAEGDGNPEESRDDECKMPQQAVARRHIFENQPRVEADFDFDESWFVCGMLHGRLLLLGEFFQSNEYIVQLFVGDGGADVEDGSPDFIGADFIDSSDEDVVEFFRIVSKGAGIDFVSYLNRVGDGCHGMLEGEVARGDADGGAWAVGGGSSCEESRDVAFGNAAGDGEVFCRC